MTEIIRHQVTQKLNLSTLSPIIKLILFKVDTVLEGIYVPLNHLKPEIRVKQYLLLLRIIRCTVFYWPFFKK